MIAGQLKNEVSKDLNKEIKESSNCLDMPQIQHETVHETITGEVIYLLHKFSLLFYCGQWT